MTVGSTPLDGSTNPIPLSSAVVPGISDPVAIQGSTNTTTDVNNNKTTPVNFNLKQVGDTGVSNSNPVPTLNTAQPGYVAPWGSNGAATQATTDYAFKWGGSGTTQVNHVMLQNNTGADVKWDIDQVSNAGSPILATGQTLFLDVQMIALHLYTVGVQNVNGNSGGNIVVRAWL